MKNIYHLLITIYYLLGLKKFNSQCRSGFTLVEMLIYMGLFVILLGVFIQLFSSLISTQLNSQGSSGVSEDTKYILSRLAYDIGRSQNIISPLQGVSSSSVELVINGSIYTYASSSGNLILSNNSGNSQLNGSDTTVSNLSFTPVGSSSGKYTIKINLTLTSLEKNHNNQESEVIQTTLGNR